MVRISREIKNEWKCICLAIKLHANNFIFINFFNSCYSLVNEHFGSSKPQKEEDSYGTPIGQPVSQATPIPPSTNYQPSFSEVENQYNPVPQNIAENNPFTQPPYQTPFTPTPSVNKSKYFV